MDIEQKVRAFIADAADIPLSSIHDDLELANGVDWSRVHEDEYRYFFENFMQEFKIYDPRSDFKKYAQENELAWYRFPFSYLKFKLFFQTDNIESITVRDLIEVAKKGKWDL